MYGRNTEPGELRQVYEANQRGKCETILSKAECNEKGDKCVESESVWQVRQGRVSEEC